MNLTKFYLFICAILVISFSVIKAQTPSDQIAALLQKIKTYDYGDSRKNLTALSDLLRSINTAEDQISQAEIQLIRFLESDATLPAKQFISEELSIYGSAKSVPVLDQMLYRLETVNMALFTLERIPGEGSIESIRNALTKTSGKTQAAVINALGNRRDKESLNMFSTLTADKDSRIASAAINALANIGTDQASVVLAELIKDKEYSLSDQAVDAYLRTADGFALVGEPEKALTIYQKLFHRDYKRAVRIAALKGIVEQSDDNG
jgi:HEAT repeat protein